VGQCIAEILEWTEWLPRGLALERLEVVAELASESSNHWRQPVAHGPFSL